MNQDDVHEMREMMIAKQVARIIPELKLVDPADFIVFIHDEHFANISDIIDAATELHFYPHTVRFANGGNYQLDWDTPPTITLDMEFSNDGVTAYFHIIMSPEGFGIELDNVVFENPQDDEADTRQLIDALNNARLKKSANK
ncbi:hypothetical protein H3V17_06930 [Bartonella sp. M0283]|uniref:hypothetical protein n=1 Tax=Bartonella sp. M0283 TaxID=2751016 RepID=UPI0018DC375E|nr:hypothetical protein [Bartonella sp. M0283]MBI0163378.1 hypothetical protein [Bartonella sp. M0283]